MKVLLDMRPALDGHSGIPQETRLLFRGLAQSDGIAVMGLLQSGNLVLEQGLPVDRSGVARAGVSAQQRSDRLSQVVVSLQQGSLSHRLEAVRKRFLFFAGPIWAAIGGLFGVRQRLTVFEPARFEDFVWRAMFAKTLKSSDFGAVTDKPFRVLRWPWTPVNALGVASGYLGYALYPRLDTRGIDLFIAETPYPGRVSRGTAMIVRYHDAIPLLMPHTIKDRGYHRAMHMRALQRNAADGAWFACVSEATRRDLLSVMPELEPRAVTIPNMVSDHFYSEQGGPERVPEIIWSRKNRAAPHAGGSPIDPAELVDGALPYLLMVSTIEPRKNHQTLVDAWELLRTGRFPRLHLVCVGGLGWEHEAIVRRFAPWLDRGGLHLLESVPSDDLRQLYRHAQATVCPSFGEGFDFSGVEAMASGGIVAASDIQVHRDIYGPAAEYFSAYSAIELAATLERMIEHSPSAHARRAELTRLGLAQAQLYTPARVVPQWQDFLQRLHATQR